MLFHALRAPHSGVDIEQFVFTLDGPIDALRLQSAWQCVTERYDALRSSFRWDGDRPMQDVWARITLPFTLDDQNSLASGDRDAYLEACIRDDRTAGISLATAPLQRLRLIRFSDTTHTLLWTFHHAVLDGRAATIVLRDVADAYAERPLAMPIGQLRSHIAWLEQRDVAASEPFWRTYLEGIIAPIPLPVSSSAAEPASTPTVIATRVLSTDTTATLTAFASANGLTLNTLAQAAWSLFLARHANESDVVFGAVRACRHSGVDHSDNIVGLLINTLPMRVRVDESLPLVSWLHGVRAQWNALRDVEHTPLHAVSGWSGVRSPASLFDTLFVYEREPFRRIVRSHIDPSGALGICDVRVFRQTGSALTLIAAGTAELELSVQASSPRFRLDDAERFADQLVAILHAFANPATVRVGDVSMLTAYERHRVITTFNRTSEYPRDATIHQLFAEQASRTPDAIAAQLNDATMTYGELSMKADAVAAYLGERGIGRYDYVGICVERSFEMLAALLGILKAGAASVALDAAHPPERIAFMAGEAAITLVLAQTHLIDAVSPALELPAAYGARAVSLETIIARPAKTMLMPPVAANDAAHVMYTSGSTGTPKGAIIPHRAAIRTVRGADYLHFDAAETFLAFVPLTFDVSMLEIWGALLNGARLVLAPPGALSLDVLASTIANGGVTTLWLTTALFEQMVEEQLPQLRGVRQLIVGGDVLSPAHVRRALAGLPNTRLINAYGPTEATVLITAQPISVAPAGPIPIGAPIANAAVYVLDAERRPVPVGVPGEIYTGGDGLALGYLNRPELTTERFVPDSFGGCAGATLYRTGDHARWRADGSLDFIGRVDHQVKIRGVRIELGEIEATLTQHPAVREAAVTITSSGAAEKHLAAYIVVRAGVREPTPSDVLKFLSSRLSSQMIPASVTILETFPLTATGKVDRAALPKVVQPHRAPPTRLVPKSAAEIAVAAHFAEILGLEDIGLDDDFYACGGDSLRAMRLVSRLRASFHVDLSVRNLLDTPRVGDLTATLIALRREPGNGMRSKLTALCTTSGKTPLFFLHGDLAGGGNYTRKLAAHFDGERPLYVISPHGTDGDGMPPSIEAMARDNVAEIRSRYPHGPVVLAGFCNGGIMAYEMALQCERARIAVEGVIVVDARIINVQPLPLRTRLRHGARKVIERYRALRPARFGATAWDDWHEAVLERWMRVLARYVPGAFAGPVSLLWSDEIAPESERQTARWRTFAPDATSSRIPGTHLTTMTRHLDTTSRILVDAVRAFDMRSDWGERASSTSHLHRPLQPTA